jgi:hypothetical protein
MPVHARFPAHTPEPPTPSLARATRSMEPIGKPPSSALAALRGRTRSSTPRERTDSCSDTLALKFLNLRTTCRRSLSTTSTRTGRKTSQQARTPTSRICWQRTEPHSWCNRSERTKKNHRASRGAGGCSDIMSLLLRICITVTFPSICRHHVPSRA